jgi:uncharacterized protein (TIGR02118 family)
MIRVSVLYPKPGKFDIDYYATKHMALVHRLIDPYGLVETEVNKGVGDSPFLAIGHLVFKCPEDMQRALAAHDKDFGADLPNFTDIQPQFQVSEIVGK